MRKSAYVLLVLGLAMVATGTTMIVIDFITANRLPNPPKLTVIDMVNMGNYAEQLHMERCLRCKAALDANPNAVPYCAVLARVGTMQVGDWLMVGCQLDRTTCLWKYTGPKYAGWRWCTFDQCWKVTRKRG